MRLTWRGQNFFIFENVLKIYSQQGLGYHCTVHWNNVARHQKNNFTVSISKISQKQQYMTLQQQKSSFHGKWLYLLPLNFKWGYRHVHKILFLTKYSIKYNAVQLMRSLKTEDYRNISHLVNKSTFVSTVMQLIFQIIYYFLVLRF